MMLPDSEMWPLVVLFFCLLASIVSFTVGHLFFGIAFGLLGVMALFVEW